MSLDIVTRQIAEQITDTRRLQIMLDGQFMLFELQGGRLHFREQAGKLLSDALLSDLQKLIATGIDAEKIWARYAASVGISTVYFNTCPELIVYSGPSAQFFSKYWS